VASVNSPKERSLPEVRNPKVGKGKKLMSMKLYVGNLSFDTSKNELQTLFAQTGTVESVSLIEDRETGRSRGFGFIEMSTKEEGAAAIEKLNGQELGGRSLKVNVAKQRESRVGF
jgi:RNA recognition motif-containing protein